jgi:hypothetical protein
MIWCEKSIKMMRWEAFVVEAVRTEAKEDMGLSQNERVRMNVW